MKIKLGILMRIVVASLLAAPVVAFESGYAPVRGLNLYYEIHGKGGRPLLLLPGGGSTIGTTFGRILPALAAGRKVIVMEEQGHGHTADIDRPLTFEGTADDAAALLHYLKIEQADVLGFSNGGNSAMQLAIRHPKLVRKLIMASAFFKNEGIPKALRDYFKSPAASDPKGMPPALREAYLAAAPEPDHLPRLVGKLMKRLANFKDWTEKDLGTITAPTMVITGDSDIATLEHTVEMMRAISGAKLAVIPGGHGEYLGEVTTLKPGSKLPELGATLFIEFLDAPQTPAIDK